MNLKTKVKVGNITNLSDARYCSGMGVQMLGFCFEEGNENYIDPAIAKEIIGWLAGPSFIAEYGNTPANQILEKVTDQGFEVIQISNTDSALPLLQANMKVGMELNIDNKAELAGFDNLPSGLEYLIVNSGNLNLTKQLNERIQGLDIDTEIYRAYDVEQSKVGNILESKLFSGIALSGSHEEKPGFKDYDELADILEELEDY